MSGVEVIYRGMPGHFLGARNCCFHLHTEVAGRYRVSTVGCYHGGGEPTYESRREIGLGRLYETYVFRLGTDGSPTSWGEIEGEIEGEGYNEESEAEAGHAAMVRKYVERAETEAT